MEGNNMNNGLNSNNFGMPLPSGPMPNMPGQGVPTQTPINQGVNGMPNLNPGSPMGGAPITAPSTPMGSTPATTPIAPIQDMTPNNMEKPIEPIGAPGVTMNNVPPSVMDTPMQNDLSKEAITPIEPITSPVTPEEPFRGINESVVPPVAPTVTQTMQMDRAKKEKNKGSNNLFTFMLILIIIVETLYIAYIELGVGDMSNLMNEVAKNNVKDMTTLLDTTLEVENQNTKLYEDFDAQYPIPTNALDKASVVDTVNNIKYNFYISEDKKLCNENSGIVENITIGNIMTDEELEKATNETQDVTLLEDVRYFYNVDNKLYVATYNKEAYVVDALASEIKAVKVETDKEIINLSLSKEVKFVDENTCETLTDVYYNLSNGFSYKLQDGEGYKLSDDIVNAGNVKALMPAFDKMVLAVNNDDTVSFYGYSEGSATLLSNLTDANDKKIQVKEVLVQPIQDGANFRYKYFVISNEDKLYYVFSSDIKTNVNTQAVAYSNLKVTNFEFVKDEVSGKNSSAKMQFVVSEEPLTYQDLEIKPFAPAKNEIFTLVK